VKTFTSLLINFSLVSENSGVKTFTKQFQDFSSRDETSPLNGESAGVGFGVVVFAAVLAADVWVYAVICQTTTTQNTLTLNNPNDQALIPCAALMEGLNMRPLLIYFTCKMPVHYCYDCSTAQVEMSQKCGHK